MPRIPLRRIGIVLLALVLPAAFYCFQDWIAWKFATNWKTTEGLITESSVVEVEVRMVGQRSILYVPAVVYRYALPGELFNRSRISFGGRRFREPEDAAMIVARYPVGRKVVVRYDPHDPGDSVLELTEPKVNYLLFGLLIALAVGAFAAILTSPVESEQFIQQP